MHDNYNVLVKSMQKLFILTARVIRLLLSVV